MIKIHSGNLEAEIALNGAELKHLRKGNKDYLWCGDSAVWGQTSPVLFPFCGALKGGSYTHESKDYAIGRHGFARNLIWEAVEATDNSCTLKLTDNDFTRSVYPFCFCLNKKLTLKDNTLSIEFTVLNNGKSDMYFGIGGHTAFSCENGKNNIRDFSIEFEKNGAYFGQRPNVSGQMTSEKVEFSADGKLPLAPFILVEECVIFDNIQSHSLLLKQFDKPYIKFSFFNLPALVFWTPKGTDRFVCIEPWTSGPERDTEHKELSKKENLVTLKPHSTKSFGFNIEIL